jgi:hypothetical protein
MANEMGIDGLFDVGVLAGLFAHKFNARGGDGLGDAVSGKEPRLQASGSVRSAVPEGPFPHTARCHRT